MKKFKSCISKIGLKRTKSNIKKVKLTNSKEVSEFARQFYSDDLTIYESVFLILLNTKNITIGYAKICQGGVRGSSVDLQIILKYCLDTLAQSFILIHNHPSGALEPTYEDIAITKAIKKGAELFHCELFDHLILTDDGYFSFKDEDLIV